MSWPYWAVGVVVLALAGFGTAFVARQRARGIVKRTAWSSARDAVARAGVSRDACAADVPDATDLLYRAELIVAGGGGVAAARDAAKLATDADRLWRAHAG